MTIQTDFEARFPSIPWVEEIASTWPSYTCLEYNDKNKEAILNLIAHLLTLASAPGAGGGTPARNVASKSVGSVSVSYEATAGQSSNIASWFNTTRYGQVYWLLTGRRIGARFV
jgi:hypothetical protein